MKLMDEKKALKIMIIEVEEHALVLKHENTLLEENKMNQKEERQILKEKQEILQTKEEELLNFEIILKKKAKIFEEDNQTMSKLEMQIKGRLHQVAKKEAKTSLFEKELERLQEEQFVHEKGSSSSCMFEMEHIE
ncbi:unnamed protein product [Sphagnum compactum]